MLEICNQVTDPGVVIDNSLSFVPHVVHITGTTFKHSDSYVEIQKNTSVSCIKILYYALERSTFKYCHVILCLNYQFHINMLENVLSKFAKYVSEDNLLCRRNVLCYISSKTFACRF